MSYQLRPYQSDLISRIFYQWQTHRHVIAKPPTGGGKSVIFGAIAFHFVRAGWAFYHWQEQQRGMAA